MRFSFPILGAALLVAFTAPFVKAVYTQAAGAITGVASIPSSSVCADRNTVPGQCTASAASAASSCDADANCGGYTCGGTETSCQLRYYPLTPVDPTWTSFSSFIKSRYSTHAGAITDTYSIPTGSACADPNTVPGQCTVSTASAASTCDADSNCGGYTCGGTNCQLRYYPLSSVDPTWTSFSSFIKSRYEAYSGAITGSYSIPTGSTCADPNTVPGQCSVPPASAASTCDADSHCGGYTCGGGATCQLRYYPLTNPDPSWTGFTSAVKA